VTKNDETQLLQTLKPEQLQDAQTTFAQQADAARDRRNHEARMLDVRRHEARDRREWMSWCMVGVGFLTFLLALIVALSVHERQEQRNEIDTERQRQQTAQRCIDAGHVWIQGNCIPSVAK
jgi:hypothetical protein